MFNFEKSISVNFVPENNLFIDVNLSVLNPLISIDFKLMQF